MKIFLYLTLIFISLASFTCSKNRIVISEEEITNDLFYLKGEIEPFTGICIIPHEDGKSIKEVRRFNEGIIDGEALSYYSNGTLKRKGEYKNGAMDGLWEQWYVDGKKEFQAVYINDSMSGCFKEWYENGKIKEEGQLFKNERIGKWKFYNETGLLSFEKEYNKLAQPISKSNQIPCI